MAIEEYVAGNTIKIRATFTTFDDATPSEEPTNIVLKIYDSNMKQYGASISLDSGDKVDIGVYDAYYTLPEDYINLGKECIMYYKFTALLEGYPISDTGSFKRVFKKSS